MSVENKSQVIKNASKAYGYNYARLGDIAKAGFTIPQMRIKPTDTGEFIEYLDDKGEWQTGAKIVVPDMKGSNEAQRYGAAVTYARRFSVQLALGLVSSDDETIETHDAKRAAENEEHNRSRLSFDDIRAHLKELNTIAEINAYAKEVAGAYPNPTDKQRHVINMLFSTRREEITVKRVS